MSNKTGWSKADRFQPYPRESVRTKEEAIQQAQVLLKEIKKTPAPHKKIQIGEAIDDLRKCYKITWKELYGR